jgi:cell wall-associated NlpC family hydrolase
VTAGGLVAHAPAASASAAPGTPASTTVSTVATPISTVATPVTTSVTTVNAQAAVRTSVKSSKSSKAARQRTKAGKALAVAKKQIGDPYRYGGTGPGSFDCSGLVQFAWKKAGVKIPRVTNSQFAGIRKKVSYRHLKPGDLMFFRGFGHVGMYVGNGKMIHSPRTGERVRIEKLSGWRKSSFAGAVRPGL